MKIYLNYFSSAAPIENKILTPIQVGRALSSRKLNMIGDDTGDNISKLNPFFNELSGQYWVWKNALEDEHIGFFHYRRFLDFRPDAVRIRDVHGLVVEPCFYKGFLKEFGLDEESLQEFGKQYDIILPKPFNVTDVGQKDAYSHYRNAEHHFARDYKLAGEVILDFYPDDYHYFKEISRSNLLYMTNIFVMRKDIFRKYCEWMFPLLFRLHEKIDVSKYTAPEKRAVGYLAERLFSVYIRKYLTENPDCRWTELERVFVTDTSPLRPAPLAKPADPRTVTLVASTDRAYIAQLASLLASVATSVSKSRPVELVVLDGGLTEAERDSLVELTGLHPDFKLHFLDMAGKYSDVEMHSYFTASTLFRLGLPELLPNHDKILFLDTDMIVLEDISDLFDQDIGDSFIGATPDLVMRAFCSMGVLSTEKTGVRTASKYLSEHLRLGDDVSGYFQAGTLLFNLNAMRDAGLSSSMIADIRTSTFWFFDQDVLNKHCRGRVHYLDSRWNTVCMDDRHLSSLLTADQVTYQRSLERPAIVHYAGQNKPWETSLHPLGHHFWKYLRMTRWYEQTLFGFLSRKAFVESEDVDITRGEASTKGGIPFKLARILWHCFPKSIRYRFVRYGVRIKRRLS